MPTRLRFDCFEVDLTAREFYKRGTKVPLRDQAFQVLAALLEHPGQLVSRDDLRRRLWPDGVFVDFDNILNSSIARLRDALHDSADHPRFIETLPKRGYRFIATTSELPVAAPAPAKRVRLLVLPFVNSSGDPAQEFSSDAMTDDVITELAATAPGELAVIARTTAMRYKGRKTDAAHIGRELHVDYIVEGGVRRGDGRISVNVQVIRAIDQEHVFAKRYDEDSTEAFGLQGRIAREVADQFGAAAGVQGFRVEATGRDRATRRPTEDVTAYNEYVQGLYHLDHMSVGSKSHEKARAHLERAIARDPGFALAHEALAQVYWILGYVGFVPPQEAFASGILHAVRALEIDNTRAETHALVAQFHKQRDYNWPDIERGLARALELNPASGVARMLYAVGWLMPQGRLVEAIAELERTLERDPLSYQLHFWLAIMHSLARDVDRVVDQTRLLIQLDQAASSGWWLLGVGLSRKGMIEEALAALRRAVDLSSGAAVFLGWLGLILGLAGRADEARGVLARLEAMSPADYVPPASVAWVYLGLRDVDRAFEWLDRAVDAHDQVMMPIKSYAFFDPIRDDARFHALLRKMRLEP